MKTASVTEIHSATGAYAVDALDPDELAAFEAHREACSTCSQEVAEFCETAPRLSVLIAAPAPPPALRESIMAGLVDVRQLPSVPGAAARPAPDLERQPAPALPALPSVAAEHRSPVDELARRRSGQRARVLSVLVAAVTVVALALGGVVYSMARQQQAPVAGPSADTSLLAAPDAHVVPLVLANGAQVSFVVSKSQNRALFVGSDLPSAGTGKTYQLWTLNGRTVVPDNLVSGGTNVSQWFHGPISSSTDVAVSIEDAGGSAQPTAVQGRVSI